MTIGPAPMTRILWMSVLLGMRARDHADAIAMGASRRFVYRVSRKFVQTGRGYGKDGRGKASVGDVASTAGDDRT